MKGYLFAHFKGTESTRNDEQIYFALSRDGITWYNVNEGKPILVSDMGERGLRDPHILRTSDGKYHLIATDLSVFGRKGMDNLWRDCETNGSQSICVWHSDDLVNWSEQKLIKVADGKAGCTWAPETVYDHEQDEYMVFWASRTADDGYTKQRIWRAYTKDFENFSEPEIYIDKDYSVIDTTIIFENGKYYRFTKNEDSKKIFLDYSESLNGKFTENEEFSLKDDYGYEGPTICRLNNEEKWCLLLDNFATHEGYKPFVTSSLDKADFTRLEGFNTPDIYRHGTIFPITEDEYDAIVKKWGIDE